MRERCLVHGEDYCQVRVIDPPAQHPYLTCTHCRCPIQAVAEHVRSLLVDGLRQYDWTHVWTGEALCYLPRHAGPYDGWDATRLVERVEREERERQDLEVSTDG